MHKKQKRKTIAICFMLAFLLLGGSFSLFSIFAQSTSPLALQQVSAPATITPTEYATISPVIYDGITNQPICDATIVIPETGRTCTTDATGCAGTIEVPIIHDTRFDTMHKKPWGEISILVYKDGYRPYGLFYVEVYAGEDRSGPNIYMYPGDENSAEPFYLIEGPNRLWAKNILDKYRP